MPLDNSATATTATNSATYLVKRRLRILVRGGDATGSATACEASSVRPCGASGCSEMLIPTKLARRHGLVSRRSAGTTKVARDNAYPKLQGARPPFSPDWPAIGPSRPANSSGRDG